MSYDVRLQAGKISTADAAKRIGVSKGFLDKLRITGEGPAFFKLGRKVLYVIDDVDAWQASKRATKASAVRGEGKCYEASATEHDRVAA